MPEAAPWRPESAEGGTRAIGWLRRRLFQPRSTAGQSFVDPLDPSWGFVGETVVDAGGSGPQPGHAAFGSENKIPRRLRYGAASYVERFMKNPEAAAGTNPWDLREFACSEVKRQGGLQKLDEIIAFKLDIAKPDESSRLCDQAGLVVAYLMDGSEGDK